MRFQSRHPKLLLTLLAPLLAAIALAVRLDSKGPAFFRQQRVGREGRRFWLLKFRAMLQGAERLDEELMVRAPDHSEPDPVRPDRRRCYARGVGPSAWLVVIVSYEQEPARIVSAFANRKDPPTWSA